MGIGNVGSVWAVVAKVKFKFFQNCCLCIKAGRVRWEEASQRRMTSRVPHTTTCEIGYLHVCVLMCVQSAHAYVCMCV